MVIKILGSGCNNCNTLETRTRAALEELGITATLEKVTDYPGILGYGATSTPGLVVDEKLVMAGRVPLVAEIKTLLSN